MAVSLLSVAEAADRLGVSPSRIRQRIGDGSLAADRVGNQWVIHPQVVQEGVAKRSRPMSARMAWALLEMMSGSAVSVSAAERVRLRQRVRRLREADDPESLLRSWVGSRAERRKLNVAGADAYDLRADGRVQLSGLSAPDSGVIAHDVVEGYVRAADVAGLVGDCFLVEPADHRGNVILHVVPGGPPEPDVRAIGWPLLAADLAEHSGARERSRARELLRENLGS